VCGAGLNCTSGACVLTPYGSGSSGTLTTSSGGLGVTTLNQTLSSVMGTTATSVLTLATPSGFHGGDVIFLHQSQGTGAGFWEMNEIASIDGGTVATLFPLAHSYTTNSISHAQVVQVPQYTTVDVTANSILDAPAWNGSVGGILVFLAQTSVSIEGAIVMDGAGFQGGSATLSGNRGYTGESELGPSVPFTKANNGSGGGGGGDCTANVAGSGGHATPATASTQTSGGTLLNCFGIGGAASADTADLSLMLFGGGGGGAGDGLTSPPPPSGASGGGIVFVATSKLNVTGTVSSSGGGGVSVQTSSAGTCAFDALAGNGAGGSIYLKAASGSLGISVLAVGGQTFTESCGPNVETNGTGGAGRIHLTGGITGTTTPAAQ
jgi:hypothetical protein